MATQVENLDHLKKLAENGTDFHIRLNGGFRSSKNIYYNSDNNTFEISHYIDDTDEYITEQELIEGKTNNVYEALQLGALWMD
jgi:hypothetical protein